ncbi:unnamed protein product [Rotaria sordida]|uniref:Ion transport domain-containing protein n=1 Tax=Rotaria sordida TaxID=392033 RepID=A0A819IPX7_9BILA|nr:unnamed protein product [Rotaria sordida]
MLELFENFPQWSEVTTYDNKRPIDIAAEYGHVDIVKKYLHKNENPNSIHTLIRGAIRRRTGSVLDYVRKNYGDEDNSAYRRALHYACRQFYGHQSIKPIISEWEMTTYDINGYTPLMVAIKHRRIDARKTQQSKNESTMWTMTNHNKWTALHEAIQNGYPEIVETMHANMERVDFEKMADMADEELRTPLHMAAAKGYPDLIKFFATEAQNACVHARDFIDRTPLHDAASWSTNDDDENKGRIEFIDILVKLKADINATDIRRDTPLHVACKTGSHMLVKHLLKLKVDLLVTNIQGFNCLEVAIEEGNERVVKYLLEHERGFELMRNAQNEYPDNTPMRKLIRSMPDMAKLIIDECTLTVGAEKSHIHMEIYNYEFLEDWYFIDDWKNGLCENVSRAIASGTIDSEVIKQTVDYWLKYILYVLMAPIFVKNFWIIRNFAQLDLRKLFTVSVELGAIGLGAYFIYDYNYQENIVMRCPIQWQLGAFGLFLSYVGMSYYIQYAPIVGVYVVMMIAIFQRFFLFLPVIVVLVCAFGFCFYMIFQNHIPFSQPGLALDKAAMMISGEINFNDVMFSDEKEAYYKLGYVMFILFALCMTVITTNVLIGLAVGEVQALLIKAKSAQLDMTYELVRDYEILRMQFNHCICNCCRRGTIFETQTYKAIDIIKLPCSTRLGKWLSKLFTHELFASELGDEASEDHTEQQMNILVEIQNEMRKLPKPQEDKNENKGFRGPNQHSKPKHVPNS